MRYQKAREIMLEGLAVIVDIYPANRIAKMSNEELLARYNEFYAEKPIVETFYYKDKKDIANKTRYLKKVSNFLIDAEFRLFSAGLLK